MAKVAVIIPSRKERFLTPTVHDVFAKAGGDIEVIVVLEEKWPDDWTEVAKQYPNLHTIHHAQAKGMRPSLNEAAALAVKHKAKYLFKLDAHCMVDEGFDVKLAQDCEPNWVVVPRRYRLDPINWSWAEVNKPPIDYHYLSYPDDPQDWGGPGLNGKVWTERAKARQDILIDEEMSSQGSGWFMHAKYYKQLELFDDKSYGPFWSEFQEIGMNCWLSGGQVMVNKKTWYAHLHKGKTYGRGYRLEESALQKGRSGAMRWLANEAWSKQTMPFSWLVERFWPIPGWPEDWREKLWANGKEPW